MTADAPAPSAYDRYLKDRDAEERRFRENSNDYVRFRAGDCDESCPTIGRCGRTEAHFTHEARAANGNVLGRWRVRRQIEIVDPNIQLPD